MPAVQMPEKFWRAQDRKEKESRILYVGYLIATFLFYLIGSEASIDLDLLFIYTLFDMMIMQIFLSYVVNGKVFKVELIVNGGQVVENLVGEFSI